MRRRQQEDKKIGHQDVITFALSLTHSSLHSTHFLFCCFCCCCSVCFVGPKKGRKSTERSCETNNAFVYKIPDGLNRADDDWHFLCVSQTKDVPFKCRQCGTSSMAIKECVRISYHQHEPNVQLWMKVHCMHSNFFQYKIETP